MPILDLQFTHAGPFDDVTFEFDEHVNVFVGPNNSGKSTALTVLGAIVVYPFAFPKKFFRHADINFIAHFTWNNSEVKAFQCSFSTKKDSWSIETLMRWIEFLKEIGYASFIPALRQSTEFRSEGPMVKTKKVLAEQRVSPLPSASLIEELVKREDLFETNSSLIRDEAVIESIIELDYRAYRQNDPAIRSIINKVAAMASEITEGFPIEFLRIAEDQDGLFPQFRTPDGDVPLNVLSQGTQSILQWLAYLLIGYAKYYDYPSNLEEKSGILIIDEIDAHLHPSWQRRIIPTLRRHFPNLQLFCSTHSPLMLAGLEAGQVQLLKRDNGGKVTVSRNETDIIGWSADEILRNFLNVSNPTDFETDCHIRRLQELRRIDKLSPEEAAELEHLRHTVSQELLGGPMTTQMEQLSTLFEQAKAGPASASKPVSKRKAQQTTKPGQRTSTSSRTTK